MAEKKDFLGNTLQKGDTVVFIVPSKRDFLKGTIKSLADKQATISYVKEYRYYNHQKGCITTMRKEDATTRQYYERIVKDTTVPVETKPQVEIQKESDKGVETYKRLDGQPFPWELRTSDERK